MKVVLKLTIYVSVLNYNRKNVLNFTIKISLRSTTLFDAKNYPVLQAVITISH
jgi:hypothetical protein